MKNIILTISLLFLMISCDNSAQQNEINKSKMDAAQTKAEQSSGNISELPLDFEFGMTRNEVNKHLEKLAKKANIDPNNIEEFYKHFSALEAKRKKEGIGIYPSDLKVKVSVTNQSYIYDKDDTYILSIDGDK